MTFNDQISLTKKIKATKLIQNERSGAEIKDTAISFWGPLLTTVTRLKKMSDADD